MTHAPWKTYGEGPTEVSEGEFTDTKRSRFTGQDIRFTYRDDNLYAVCLGWPDHQTVVISLSNRSDIQADRIQRISMLGSDEELKWSQDDSGLRIMPPSQKPM